MSWSLQMIFNDQAEGTRKFNISARQTPGDFGEIAMLWTLMSLPAASRTLDPENSSKNSLRVYELHGIMPTSAEWDENK